MSKDQTKLIQQYTEDGNIQFRNHALIRIVERNIKIEEVIEVLLDSRIIESYPEDKPFESYLLLGYTSDDRPLHIVVGVDDVNSLLWIITVYEPDVDEWNDSLTKRKKS